MPKLNSVMFGNSCDTFVSHETNRLANGESAEKSAVSQAKYVLYYLQNELGLSSVESLKALKPGDVVAWPTLATHWGAEKLVAMTNVEGVISAYFVGQPDAQRSAFIEFLLSDTGYKGFNVISVYDNMFFNHPPTSINYTEFHKKLLKKMQFNMVTKTKQSVKQQCKDCVFRAKCFGDAVIISDVPDITDNQISQMSKKWSTYALRVRDYIPDMKESFDDHQWRFIERHRV